MIEFWLEQSQQFFMTPGYIYVLAGAISTGQTFRDLHTLLHTFFGFSGACCKVIILIDLMEGWTFVGLC